MLKISFVFFYIRLPSNLETMTLFPYHFLSQKLQYNKLECLGLRHKYRCITIYHNGSRENVY